MNVIKAKWKNCLYIASLTAWWILFYFY